MAANFVFPDLDSLDCRDEAELMQALLPAGCEWAENFAPGTAEFSAAERALLDAAVARLNAEIRRGWIVMEVSRTPVDGRQQAERALFSFEDAALEPEMTPLLDGVDYLVRLTAMSNARFVLMRGGEVLLAGNDLAQVLDQISGESLVHG